MFKLLLGVLLLPAVALAQPVTVEKPVYCDKPEALIRSITGNNYKERPKWLGEDEKSRYSLFVNEETGSWTIIQFNDKIACVLGVGESSKFVLLGPKT